MTLDYMYLFVGSTNPVKINAVTFAASETWPDAQVTGFSVPSGIKEQPLTDSETRQGSYNRAVAALEDGLNQLNLALPPREALGVGLEGGVFIDEDDQMWSTVWASVFDQEGRVYQSNGARFLVPQVVAERIRAGEEMGPVMSRVVGEEDVRSKQGMIGIITNNFVDRTEEYAGIAKMALGLWYGREWDQAHLR